MDSLPSLETVHETFVPTVTWVPKPARAAFARVFASQSNRVVFNPDNISAWILQLMFAKCILPAVKSRPDITQARAVRDRLARWRAGEYAALWREAVDMTRKRGKQTRKNQWQEQQSLEVKNAQRSKRFAQEGEYTHAVQALTSAGLADHTPATIRAMRDKHPTAQPSTFQSSDTSPQLAFTAKQVQRAIKSFRKGFAPGPDGRTSESCHQIHSQQTG